MAPETENGTGDVDAAKGTEYDADEIEEDGINTRVATVWIIGISVVITAAVLCCVILLAKRNKNQK